MPGERGGTLEVARDTAALASTGSLLCFRHYLTEDGSSTTPWWMGQRWPLGHARGKHEMLGTTLRTILKGKPPYARIFDWSGIWSARR